MYCTTIQTVFYVFISQIILTKIIVVNSQSTVAISDCQNGCSEKLLEKIKNINNLESFKSSLNKSMKYLDKQ